MKEPLIYLLKSLLRKHKIFIDEQELEFQLLSHPSYPSLNSLTGVLDHFGIRNYALEVPKTTETFPALPEMFLAFMKDDEHNDFALVLKSDQYCQLIYNDKDKVTLSSEEFLKIWPGILLVIEQEEGSQIEEIKRTHFTTWSLLLLFAAIISLYFLIDISIFPALHYLFSLGGLGICILILYHEMGISSKILDRFCSQDNKMTSCDAVMNSAGANILGSIKLSDIGIVYFIALILSWNLLKVSNSSVYSIVLITVAALPFTFYSVYYQYRIVKKWCPLCLGVVIILWLQAFSLIFYENSIKTNPFSLESISIALLCFVFSFALWQIAKERLESGKEFKTLKIEYYRFVRNYNIFKSLINRSSKIDTKIHGVHEIEFHSCTQIPKMKVVIVTSPLCGFCKEVHSLIESILTMKDKPINILVRFNVREDQYSIDRKIALRLLEIFTNDGPELCLESMHDIYGVMNPEDWLVKWNEAIDPQRVESSLTEAKKWCRSTNINFTPEILINGQPFPTEYKRTDLLLFIDDIIEDNNEKDTDNLNVEDFIQEAQ